jgi:hypothetical protein
MFIDYLLDTNTTGLYVCMLQMRIGIKTHVIGIDCYKKTIFDCMEDYSLCLNKENYDYCCGQGSLGFSYLRNSIN